jgi:hypothetical protein
LANDVAAFNQMCREKGVTNVILPR